MAGPVSSSGVCPECGTCLEDGLEEVGGFFVCSSCGYTLEEGVLEHQLEVIMEEGRPAGVFVGRDDDGTVAGRVTLGKHGRPLGAVLGGSSTSANTKKHLELLCDRLGLSRSVVGQALHLVERARGEGAGGAPNDILLGAVVYLVVRQDQLPLSLGKVAAAVQRSPLAVGKCFRKLTVQLEMPAPPVNLKHLVLKHGTDLLKRLPHLPDTFSSPIMKHPVLVTALALAELVESKELQARKPMVVAAAILKLSLEAHNKRGGIGVSCGEVARQLAATGDAICRDSVEKATVALQGVLMNMAKCLPYGDLLTPHSVPLQAPLLLRMRRLTQQGGGQPRGDDGGQRTNTVPGTTTKPGTISATATETGTTTATATVLPADKDVLAGNISGVGHEGGDKLQEGPLGRDDRLEKKPKKRRRTEAAGEGDPCAAAASRHSQDLHMALDLTLVANNRDDAAGAAPHTEPLASSGETGGAAGEIPLTSISPHHQPKENEQKKKKKRKKEKKKKNKKEKEKKKDKKEKKKKKKEEKKEKKKKEKAGISKTEEVPSSDVMTGVG